MYRKLSPELAKIAKEELTETPQRVANSLQSLKEWISKQPHLNARTDDQWLLALLRGCKFNLERVKVKLDLFYTLRTTASDVTLRCNPTQPEFLKLLRIGTCCILPHSKNLRHPTIILLRPGLYDPKTNHVKDVMCLLYYLVQLIVKDNDLSTVMGTVIVVDYEGVSLNHMKHAHPSTLRKLVAVGQDSLPLRVKASHHLNVPSCVDIVFKIISVFLSKKAKDRLHIHKSEESVFKLLPKDVIPKEYGGNGKTIPEILDYWEDKIKENRAWFEEEITFKTDESKRNKKKSTVQVVQREQSFRSLEID